MNPFQALSFDSIDLLTLVGYAITLPLLWIGWRAVDNVAAPGRRAVVRALLAALLATPTLFGDPSLGIDILPAILVLIIAALPAVSVAQVLPLVLMPMLLMALLSLPVIILIQRRQGGT